MGAWSFVAPRCDDCCAAGVGAALHRAGPERASPAEGSAGRPHAAEQARIVGRGAQPVSAPSSIGDAAE